MTKILVLLCLIVSLAPLATQAFEMLDPDAKRQIDGEVKNLVENNYNPATDENSLHVIVGQVITVFFGLLATIFIILMIVAGYNWMTAAGRKEKVEKAQETIKVAIIGLLITLGAYIITYFIFSGVPTGVDSTQLKK